MLQRETWAGIRPHHQRPALTLCHRFLTKLRAHLDCMESCFKTSSPMASDYFGIHRDQVDKFIRELPDAAMDAVFFGDLR